MKSPEKFNPEDKTAKEIIDSLDLGETPEGKEMKKQPMPSEDELEEMPIREINEDTFPEFKKGVDNILVAWLNITDMGHDEKESIKEKILEGDYREMISVLQKAASHDEDSKKNTYARRLLDIIQREDFQSRLDN
ncbi:MAG: hypothetical protein R3346_01310 [Candidatus Spechtbacterales bacterium]|nr:hypothetical protein [Candidatus Spechtbacterales bacterium]